MDADVADAMLKADALGELVMPEDLEAAHALVKRTHHELTRQQRKKRGSAFTLDFDDPRRPPFDVHVSEAHMRRALRMLDVLVKSLETIGASIRVTKEDKYRAESSVTLLNEEFSLRMRERMTTRPFNSRKDKRDDGQSGTLPTQVWERTGRLVIQLRGSAKFGSSREWSETESRPLGRRLAKVLADMIQYVQDERNARAESRRRAEVWRQEQEERDRAERARRIDGRRVEALLGLAARRDQAEQVRRFVVACRARVARLSADPSASRVDEWLTWAENVAARIDPLTPGVEHARETAWNVSPY